MSMRLVEEVRTVLTGWIWDADVVLVPVSVVEQVFSEREIAEGFDSGRFAMMMTMDCVLHVQVTLPEKRTVQPSHRTGRFSREEAQEAARKAKDRP